MQLPFDACGDGAGGDGACGAGASGDGAGGDGASGDRAGGDGAGGAGVKPGCATVPGPNAKAVVGRPCVFPFEFDGKRYDACTDVTDPDGKRWCSVETDAKQVHQQGRWGDCAAACPGMLPPPPPGKCESDMKKNCDSPFGFGILKIHCPAGATCVNKKCMCQSNTCFVDGICQAR